MSDDMDQMSDEVYELTEGELEDWYQTLPESQQMWLGPTLEQFMSGDLAGIVADNLIEWAGSDNPGWSFGHADEDSPEVMWYASPVLAALLDRVARTPLARWPQTDDPAPALSTDDAAERRDAFLALRRAAKKSVQDVVGWSVDGAADLAAARAVQWAVAHRDALDDAGIRMRDLPVGAFVREALESSVTIGDL